MDYNITTTGNETSVRMEGQFTFSDTQKFKNILDLVTQDKVKSLALNLAGITFIDSSSMGMLLLLRDECQSRNIPLNIRSPQGQVEKIFRISKFYDLFSIS